MSSSQTWVTSTPDDYEVVERWCIEHEHLPIELPFGSKDHNGESKGLSGDLNGFRSFDREPDSKGLRREFLSRLFRPDDGLIDLRGICKGETPRQEFVEADDFDGVEDFIERYADRDLYFGVAARRDSSSGDLTNLSCCRALHCDVDFKDTPEAIARERLEAFVPASIVVHSGNGLHVYWIVDPVDLQTDADDVRRKLKGIAEALGGDPKSAEPARVLRLPATFNYKYVPPREVLLEDVSA